MAATVNFTNATLQGTFAGTITYQEEGSAPPEGGGGGGDGGGGDANTHGKIENFDPASYTTAMTIGGQATKGLNAIKSWSVLQIDDYTLKYEVRSGDVARNTTGGWVDSSTSERSETELMPRYPAGVTMHIEYSFMLHSGSANTSQWVVLGQFHFEKGTGSPPYCVALFGEKMAIVLRGPDTRENRVWQDRNNIQRGKKYTMKVELFIKGNGTGTCKVWRDGEQIVNFSGPLGSGVSGDTHYWKQGVYRNQAPETMQASYSNTYVTAS
jgi:hypothetical protein